MIEWSTWFLYFILYSILGWLVETLYCSALVKHWVERGFLNGPLCPIYGCGAVLMLGGLEPYVSHPLLLFVLSMFGASVMEFVVSWAMEKLFGMRWWDYSDQPFNLQGRVCLLNSTLFGVMGLVLAQIVHPHIQALVALLPPVWCVLLACMSFVALCVDTVISARAALQLRGRLERMEQMKQELRQYMHERNLKLEYVLQSRLADLDEWKQYMDAVKGRITVENVEQQLREALSDRQRLSDALDHVRRWKQMQEGKLEALRQRIRSASEDNRRVQRRMLEAFPQLRAERYQDSLDEIRRAVRCWKEKRKQS